MSSPPTDPSNDVCVIIPAYNEAGMIGEVLAELTQFPYRVVVVDDGSTDQTSAAALHYPVTVLTHLTNLGQGAALATGIRYALSIPETRFIATFDADGQHHIDDLRKAVACCRESGFDVVLGSRFLQGGAAPDMPPIRRLALKLAVRLTRMSTGLNLTDTHNGLRVFSRKAASRLQITQDGMAHASEILAQVAAQKMSFCEVPITITYTAYSKLKGQPVSNFVNILWDLWIGKIR
ncbi:MAG: glycosyltransferase family 2 protein [Chloroflexi bacterium]|nr:glycosyltransferase family 2 protein [Chloroflexota bacterium]